MASLVLLALVASYWVATSFSIPYTDSISNFGLENLNLSAVVASNQQLFDSDTKNVFGRNSHLGWGNCPDKSSVINYDVQQFLDTWYVHSQAGIAKVFKLFRCVSIDYYLSGSNKLKMFQRAELPLIRYEFTLEGSAMEVDPTAQDGKMLVSYHVPVIGNVLVQFTIQSINYNKWALVWVCKDLGFFNLQSAIVLTRERTLTDSYEDAAIKKEIDGAIENAGLNKDDFVPVNQENC